MHRIRKDISCLTNRQRRRIIRKELEKIKSTRFNSKSLTVEFDNHPTTPCDIPASAINTSSANPLSESSQWNDYVKEEIFESDSNDICTISDINEGLLQSDVENRVPTPENSVSTLQADLRDWAITYSIDHKSMNELLRILRKYGHDLPSDSRNLQETPRNSEVANIKPDNFETLKKLVEDNFSKLTAEMKANFQVIDGRLKKIEDRFNDVIPSSSADDLDFGEITNAIPFDSVQQIRDFEMKLENNADLRSNFIMYLSQIGGNGLKDNVVRILRRVFTNKFGQMCSWLGLRNNFKICNLRIMEAIRIAVSESCPHKDKELEEIVSEWFRQAKQRYLREEKKGSYSMTHNVRETNS